jgi:hypothetical protein
METPLQRTIRIGQVTVGLLGLDVALTQLAGKEISEDDAVAYLFEHVSKHNYVPEQAIPKYKEALLREYRRYRDQTLSAADGLTIRILGPPCVTCNKLKTTLIEILQEKKMAADVEDINDLDEIWRYGVTKTPALIINGEVKSAGIQPPRFQLEKWVEEAVNK